MEMMTLDTTDKLARRIRRRQKILAFESEMDHSEAAQKSEDTAVPKKKKSKKKRSKTARKITNENSNLSQSSVESESSKTSITVKQSTDDNRRIVRHKRTLRNNDNSAALEPVNINAKSSQVIHSQSSPEIESNKLSDSRKQSISGDQKKRRLSLRNINNTIVTDMSTRIDDKSLQKTIETDISTRLDEKSSHIIDIKSSIMAESNISNDNSRHSIGGKKKKIKQSPKYIINTTTMDTDICTRLDENNSQLTDSNVTSTGIKSNKFSDDSKKSMTGDRKILKVRRRIRRGDNSTMETDVSMKLNDGSSQLIDTTKTSFVKERAPSPSPKRLIKQGTFIRSPKDVPKKKHEETIEEHDTFELDEPIMPSNKRKSEIYNLSTNKGVKKSRKSKEVGLNLFDNNNTLGKELPPWNDDSIVDLSLNNTANFCMSASKLKSTMKTRAMHLNTPPSGTSTPAINTKTFKLPLNKSATANKAPQPSSTNKSAQKSKTPVRTKMPNYAKIHQSSFNKMESLEEHLLRKQQRAEALLSGSKVSVGKNNPRVKESESRKQLQFNLGGTPKKDLQLAPVPSKTPLKKATTTPKKHTQLSPRKSAMKSQAKSEKKGVMFSNDISSYSPVSNGYSTPKKTDVSGIKTRIKTPAKVKSPVKVKSPIKVKSPVKVKAHRTAIPKLIQPVSRFGFKLTTENTDTKQDIIKAVATKTRVMTNKVVERRNQIKGVRSNRRFDLLMQMRQMK